MNRLFIFLFILLNISQYQCEIPPCKTNCTTSEECWHEALAYRSSELIEQLFSFSSLSVHVNTYQQYHSNELSDSTLFIQQALENHLLNELSDSNLTMDLFNETEQILIDLCENLTSTPIETVEALPPLICSLSTCSSNIMNFLALLVITILITSLILLICIIQSLQAHRQSKSPKTISKAISFINSFSMNNAHVNIRSTRF